MSTSSTTHFKVETRERRPGDDDRNAPYLQLRKGSFTIDVSEIKDILKIEVQDGDEIEISVALLSRLETKRVKY